ncbi:MAG: hypothetical protein JOZ24_10565 [Candidatus Eremiobacteraeota bacterium]|nr:hypothetical protein [Candidatus Eremiobacteraeota bacterium]
MLADGLHRLTTGAYFGETLGPWASVVKYAIWPTSTTMAWVFVVFGALWLAAALAIALGRARLAVASLAAATLWYLPFGTVISAFVLGVAIRPGYERRDLRPQKR